MTDVKSQKAEARAKRSIKRPRLRRVAKAACETLPRRRRRWVRICGWSGGGMVGAILAAITVTYLLFFFGILTVDMARPYVERALEARLAPGQTVGIGAITADRTKDGAMVLRASNIVVRDTDGAVIAVAPQADVEMQDTLFPWAMRPRRVDLVGVKVTVRIDEQGTIAISTEGGKSLQATHVPEAAAGGPGAAPAGVPAATQAPVPVPGDKVASPLGPIRLVGLAALAESIDHRGFDGGDLDSVGLKDGVLVVVSELSGRQWTFDDIDLSMSRPEGGGVAFDVRAGGTDGPWSARATIGALEGGQRALALSVRDLAPRDLLLAAGKADADILATSPLSLDFTAHIDAAGTLVTSEGRLDAGAGELQFGSDNDSRMIIDEASLTFSFDPVRHEFNIKPLVIQAGPFAAEISATVSEQPDGTWRTRTGKSQASFAGGGPFAQKEPPFILDDMALEALYDPVARRFTVPKGTLKGPQGGLTLAGEVDLSAAEPLFSLDVSMTPMPVSALKRMWPITAVPSVRSWIYDHVISGDVTRADFSLNMPLGSIGNPAWKLPPEAISINIEGSNAEMRPVPQLPAVKGASISVHGTARTVHVTATNGTVDTPGGRKLNLSQAVFDVPETVMKNPPAKVMVSLDGPAAAAVELAAMPPLRGVSSEQIDPGAVRGTISGTAQVNVILSDNITPADVDYAFEADLTDFSADKVFLGQKLDDATIRAFMTPAATVLRGDGKLGGALANFDYTKPKVGDATFVVSASLDDAARTKLNLDLVGLSGTVGVKLTGTIGPKSKSADVDLDLTAARLAELVPGWSKPAGKAARLTAKATVTGSGTRLDDLVVTGPGVNIKGTIELDSKASLVSANLPTFQLSDGDKASVKVENGDGAMKITVRGEVIEARAFLKNLLEAPIAGRKDEKPLDIDLDVKLDVVTGNNGETMRQVVLRLSRRGGTLTAFSLGGLVGREGGVTGELVANGSGRPQLSVATTDAGALLRFINLYARLYGGDLWINVDGPRGDGSPQAGVVNMRDFTIRGEPGLDRLLAAAPARGSDGNPAPGGVVAFRKLQVEFVRSSQQLNIKDGAIWGPSIGSTFDGNLDFANDRVSVRGTYVPAYGLNNLFSKLPVLGFFLGGGPNEGLVGVTYEIVGPLSGPTLRMNPISAVAPGFLRKIFEYRQAPDPTPPAVIPNRPQ